MGIENRRPQTITTRLWRSPVGELLLGSFDGRLCLCDWRYRKMRRTIDARIRHELGAEYNDGDDPVLERTIHQLEEYFAGNRREFDLPLLAAGTSFQRRVWDELRTIGYGTTMSYGNLAARLGDPAAVRAVAAANGANAISIIIPCHRIIGSDGTLTGYAGGIAAKRRLLELEERGARQGELFG